MNNENLEFENKTFYEWMESYDTAYCYLMKGGNKTYVGIIYKENEYVMKFQDKTINDCLKHLKFNKRKTNKDIDAEKTHSAYDKGMLVKCRKLTEKEYQKDMGVMIRQTRTK